MRNCGILLFLLFVFEAKTFAFDYPVKIKPYVVVRDDNRSIRGNLPLAIVWGEYLTPPLRCKRVITNIAESLTKWTDIHTEVNSQIRIASQSIHDYPVLFLLTDNSFEFVPAERANLRKYLHNGGFLVLDDTRPYLDRSPADASFRNELKKVLGSQAHFAPISFNHRILSCFFDFDGSVPLGSEILFYDITGIRSWLTGIGVHDQFWYRLSLTHKTPRQIYSYEGVWLNGRLTAVITNKGYSTKWNELTDNDPQLKIAVNMIIFALTQEGSIAEQDIAD